MFLGHFGLGLAAKSLAPRSSLGSLILGAQWADLLWPVLLLLGLEQVRVVPGITRVTPLEFVHYPISHSLLALTGWGALLAAGYLVVRRYPRGALILGLLVISHWLLDAIVHRPDLPLYPGDDTRFGLGLWASLWATLGVELGLFIAGAAVFVVSRRRLGRPVDWRLWSLLGFLLLMYAGAVFGPPPPPDTTAIAGVGLAMGLLVLWGYWADPVSRPRPDSHGHNDQPEAGQRDI